MAEQKLAMKQMELRVAVANAAIVKIDSELEAVHGSAGIIDTAVTDGPIGGSAAANTSDMRLARIENMLISVVENVTQLEKAVATNTAHAADRLGPPHSGHGGENPAEKGRWQIVPGC